MAHNPATSQLKIWLHRKRVQDVTVHLPERCTKCDTALPAVAGPDDPLSTIHTGGRAKKMGERGQVTQKEVFELWHLFRGRGLHAGRIANVA